MKIKSLTVRGYKKFSKEKIFQFTDTEGNINDTTLIIGDNGTGKSSLLQAIVILIATATRHGFNLNNLDWPGYEYRFLQAGRLPIYLEAIIVFGDNEIKKTIEYAQRKDWLQLQKIKANYLSM